MENLIESIHNYFTDEFKSQLANSLDETQPGINKAFSAIIPLSFQHLAAMSANGAEGQNELSRITSEATEYYSHAPNLAKLHNDERGSKLPLRIFGKDEHNVVRSVAAFAGIRDTSVHHLLTLILPVVSGKLGQYFLDNNLSGDQLSQFLSSKKDDILNRLPSDYSNTLSGSKDNHSNPAVVTKKKMFPTWVMFVVIILVFLLLIYFSRGCNSKDAVAFAGNHLPDLLLS